MFRFTPTLKFRTRHLKATAVYQPRLSPKLFFHEVSDDTSGAGGAPGAPAGTAPALRAPRHLLPFVMPIDPVGRMPPESLKAFNAALGRA